MASGRYEPDCPRCGNELEPMPVTEDAPPDPRNVYAATKLHQEHLCVAYGREHRSPVICLRYHNVYGPRMPRDTPYSGVAAIFKSALARGEAPRVFEDGRQRRDFVHVRDVARAFVLAAEGWPSGPVIIGSGASITVLDIVEAARECTRRQIGAVHVDAKPGEMRAVVLDNGLALSRGWSPQLSLVEGLLEAWADFAPVAS